MLQYVTKIEIENAMFLSVFNFSENENVTCYMELIHHQKCKLHGLSQEGSLTQQSHVLCLFREPNMKLKMPENIEKCISGTNNNHSDDTLLLMLQAVNDLDNVFYLQSSKIIENKTEDVYMTMNDRNACCYFKKEKPGSEGQWKLVKYNDKADGKEFFIISSLKWPGRFLHLFKGFRGNWLACTDNLRKVKEEGLWTFKVNCNLHQRRYHFWMPIAILI